MCEADIFDKLQKYVIEMEKELVIETVKEIICKGEDLERTLNAMTEAMLQVGEKFALKEYFIPEVLLAADAMNAGVKLIEPNLKTKKAETNNIVIIGTVQGDIHSLGKNLVEIMLKASGFEVCDLGVDVYPEKFVDKVKETKAKVVCLSSLMTTTRNAMKQIIVAFERAKIRDEVKVVIGGGAVSAHYAEQIGADAYGKDTAEAVKLVKNFYTN